MKHISVLNYNDSCVCINIAPNKSLVFEASLGDGQPTTIPLTLDEIRYANNSTAFKNGLLEFPEDIEDAMEINFTPSDLSVFSPANERTSYKNFIEKLENNIDIKIDDYKNRDRKTNELKQFINYSQYEDS